MIAKMTRRDRTTPAVSYPVAKQVVDRGLSGFLLLVLSPVFAFASFAIGVD